MNSLQLFKTQTRKTLAGIGTVLLLVAMTPLASAHAPATFTLASGQVVCYGPPHLTNSITVSATWNPASQSIYIGVCTAAPVNGSCAGVSPAAVDVFGPYSGGSASGTATFDSAVCVWPAAYNPGPQTVEVTLWSNP